MQSWIAVSLIEALTILYRRFQLLPYVLISMVYIVVAIWGSVCSTAALKVNVMRWMMVKFLELLSLDHFACSAISCGVCEGASFCSQKSCSTSCGMSSELRHASFQSPLDTPRYWWDTGLWGFTTLRKSWKCMLHQCSQHILLKTSHWALEGVWVQQADHYWLCGFQMTWFCLFCKTMQWNWHWTCHTPYTDHQKTDKIWWLMCQN